MRVSFGFEKKRRDGLGECILDDVGNVQSRAEVESRDWSA